MPRIARKQKTEAEVPTASMADIVFMLLIFFMLTTVFVVYRGLPVTRPAAEQTERFIEKSLLTHMWINHEGTVNIDDRVIDVSDISNVIYPKRVAEPQLVVSIIADIDAPYGTVSDAMRQIREVEALNVMFATTRPR
jgi:biopolymer transport protein ExbD